MQATLTRRSSRKRTRKAARPYVLLGLGWSLLGVSGYAATMGLVELFGLVGGVLAAGPLMPALAWAGLRSSGLSLPHSVGVHAREQPSWVSGPRTRQRGVQTRVARGVR